jgi:hypothetical protein
MILVSNRLHKSIIQPRINAGSNRIQYSHIQVGGVEVSGGSADNSSCPNLDDLYIIHTGESACVVAHLWWTVGGANGAPRAQAVDGRIMSVLKQHLHVTQERYATPHGTRPPTHLLEHQPIDAAFGARIDPY